MQRLGSFKILAGLGNYLAFSETDITLYRLLAVTVLPLL